MCTKGILNDPWCTPNLNARAPEAHQRAPRFAEGLDNKDSPVAWFEVELDESSRAMVWYKEGSGDRSRAVAR